MNILKGLHVLNRKDVFLLNRLEQLKENRCAITVWDLCCKDEEFRKIPNKQKISNGDVNHIESSNASKLLIESALMEMFGCVKGKSRVNRRRHLRTGTRRLKELG